jgi:hypothetical protein
MGTDASGVRLFYTAPARALDPEHSGTLALFRQHLTQAAGAPWIWIFDGAAMELRHYTSLTFILGLSRLLEEEHGDSLQRILLIRSNSFLTCALDLLQLMLPNRTLQKVNVITDTSIYRMSALRNEHGLSSEATGRLERYMSTPLDEVLEYRLESN